MQFSSLAVAACYMVKFSPQQFSHPSDLDKVIAMMLQ